MSAPGVRSWVGADRTRFPVSQTGVLRGQDKSERGSKTCRKTAEESSGFEEGQGKEAIWLKHP